MARSGGLGIASGGSRGGGSLAGDGRSGNLSYPFPVLLLVMAATALFCRVAGYVTMRFLPRSPRLDAALRATPVSVMAAASGPSASVESALAAGSGDGGS